MVRKNNQKRLENWVFVVLAILTITGGVFFLGKGFTGLITYDQSTTFEAEDLTLTGTYSVSTNCVCSNPSNTCIRNTGFTGQTGNLIYNFNLEEGLYDISLKHCPENDGDDIYKLYINGNLVKTFEETSDTQIWEEHLFNNVDLNPGDQVKISCPKSSGPTYCRIDQVTFNKIRETVKVNETIKDAEQNPINSTIKWEQGGEVVQESSGEVHDYELEQGDYELEIIPKHDSIKKIKLNKSITSDVVDLVDVDEDPTPDSQYSETYAIEPKDPEIEKAIMTITATGTELFKCRNWDFAARTCPGDNWSKLLDTVPGQNYTFIVDCGYREYGGCSCKGIRFVDLFSSYNFDGEKSYEVTAKVYKGSSTNQHNLIDSETINFSSIPQFFVDDNPGTNRGNLIIEEINESGVLIKFHNRSKGRLLGDNTFKITIKECEDDDGCDDYETTILGPETIHLSCSQPINIGDVFGDFEVTDLDKKLSGSSCPLGTVSLLNPPDNFVGSEGNINFGYEVYDSNQSIDYCELIINESVYQNNSSIEEGVFQYFNQNLSNGTYQWSVNCITSNGYEIESEKRILDIEEVSQIQGIITDSRYNPVQSSVKVYDSEGQLVLVDDHIYDFNLDDGVYDVQIKPTSGNFNELYIYNLSVNSDIVNFTRLEDSPENISLPSFMPNWTEVVTWLVNPLTTFDLVKVNLSYGEGTNLGLWKCSNFDFDNQTCLNEENWISLYSLPDGPANIIAYFNESDPIVGVGGWHDFPPITSLNYPPNNFTANTSDRYNLTFNCSAKDKWGANKGVKNISLYLTNNQNNSFSLNETATFSGTNKKETALFNKSLAAGNYTWNCLAYDNGGNYDWGNENRSIKIFSLQVNDTTPPIVTSTSPANNSLDDDGHIIFQYKVADNESDISFCELIINGSVADIDYTITKNITQSFTKILTNGTYQWSVNCTNTANLTGNSEIRTLVVNITEIISNVTACCCGLSVSTTPEVVAQGNKVLVAADVSNLFTGLAATPADVIDINVTIYQIENSTEHPIVNNTPMTYLAGGLWYYEFYVGNNSLGTYVASVAMLTNQTTPFVKEASDTFTVGEVVGSGLTITGVSADLININETAKLAAEIKFNGVAIDASLITNASLVIQQINSTTQMYTLNSSLQKDDGLIYLNGAFNETGVYYLDWSATYLGVSRMAREIIVVVGWQGLLEDINYTVNTKLVNLILENRQYLLDLLTNMEYLQTFTEEEVFLITDSVNSMTNVVDYLETGKITNQEAEQQFNEIKKELIDKLGDKLTGSVIGSGVVEEEKEPVDWRTVLFVVLLVMLIVVLVILLLLVKIIQKKMMPKNQLQERRVSQELPKENLTSESLVEQPATQENKTLGKRRYQLLIEKIKQRVQERKDMKPENKKTL